MNKTRVVAHIRKRFEEKLKGYVDEAEHQEGPEYWRQFVDPEEGFRDFILAVAVEEGIDPADEDDSDE